ncbi:hypothetical protein GW916_03765 [bacterium]|nr:hypothetical protein [bacterium]
MNNLNTSRLFSLLLSIVLLGGCTKEESKQAFVPTPDYQSEIAGVVEFIENPESVYFDAASKFVFVSNIAGDGAVKDANGWISKLDSAGKMLEPRWISGLDAPKGMRSRGDILWVSDIDRVHQIQISTGKILKSTDVEGAKFLNDIAIDKSGNVFVSDTITSKIHLISGDTVQVFVEGPEYESPNGLLVDGDELLVAAWGLTTDWTTKVPGKLYALNLSTKKRRDITPMPLGNLDGLEIENGGNYLVSDWVSGKVYRISKDGSAKELLSLEQGAADIGYVPDSGLLIVPQMAKNKVSLHK